jgi:hypothetical protein
MRLYALTSDTLTRRWNSPPVMDARLHDYHGPDFSQHAERVKALTLTIPNGTNDTRTMEICNAKQIPQ